MGQQQHTCSNCECESKDEDSYKTPLRLKGGGENSLSNGTSAWGTPVSQPSSNNNTGK